MEQNLREYNQVMARMEELTKHIDEKTGETILSVDKLGKSYDDAILKLNNLKSTEESLIKRVDDLIAKKAQEHRLSNGINSTLRLIQQQEDKNKMLMNFAEHPDNFIVHQSDGTILIMDAEHPSENPSYEFTYPIRKRVYNYNKNVWE